MKIATFNVNSIRKRLPIVLAWLAKAKPDVLCLQETKVSDAEFPQQAFKNIGYLTTFLGNKGYSGVATLTREKPLDWFKRLRAFIAKRFTPNDPLVWLGDLNVAPEPIDVYHPEKRLTDPCFHPAARKVYQETLRWGLIDLFRAHYPDKVQYTYWDYWRGMLEHNYGWRLDHILATKPLVKRCRKIDVDMEPRRMKEPSDHTPSSGQF